MRAEGGRRRAEPTANDPKSKIQNRKFPKTVRAKLTLTTTVVMGLVLAALGALVLFGTRKTLYTTIDADLRRRGDDFAQGQLRRRERPRDGGPGFFGGLFGGGPPPGAPNDRGPFGRRPNGLDDSRPRFIRPDGGTNGPRDLPLDPVAASRLQGRTGESLTQVTRDGGPYEIYSRAVTDGGRTIGVVQVGYPLADVEGALDGLRRLLLTVVVPLGTLLAGVASLFIVDRMLRPLRIITANAQTIGGGNLEDRLPIVGDDEFAGLATTLNGMLARLEETFRLEQATTRRLADAVEQQRRFTADASHELKTPLSTIKAHVGLLSGLENEDDRESAQAIDEAANRMRGLVDDLMVLARADGGSLTARTAPLDLSDAVSAAVGAVSPLPVEVRGTSNPLVVQGNGEALTRLFINLLDNAKKYAPGPVEIHLARRGDSAEIAVIDRGAGIAPEHLPKIFDRFYRPDESRASETGGTGLGLAICREIAQAHGGTLEVASRVGQGSAFTVVLPLV